MTVKSKARKPAAKPAPTAGEPKREVSEIQALVSRWKWLDADQSYQVSTATTKKESERLVAIHNGPLVPTAFPGVLALLDFAAIVVGGGAISTA